MSLRHIAAIATAGERYIAVKKLAGDTERDVRETDDAFNEWLEAYAEEAGGKKADDALLIILRMVSAQNQYCYEAGFCDGMKLSDTVAVGRAPLHEILLDKRRG